MNNKLLVRMPKETCSNTCITVKVLCETEPIGTKPKALHVFCVCTATLPFLPPHSPCVFVILELRPKNLILCLTTAEDSERLTVQLNLALSVGLSGQRVVEVQVKRTISNRA